MRRIKFSVLAILITALSACNNDTDSKGRLKLEKLTSASGSMSFKLMQVSDSASRKMFIPDTFFYKGKSFTGTVVHYEYDTALTMEGNMKDGVMDGIWTFYFVSGGVKMKGNICNGRECGLWQSFYGYNKVNIEKEYDDYGYLLSRKEYYDNGQLSNFQSVACPKYGKAKKMTYDKYGKLTSLYVKDSIDKTFE